MAAYSSQLEEGKIYVRDNLDKNCSLPVGCSCLKSLKPSLDDNINQPLPLDSLPILFEETSFSVGLDCPSHGLRGKDKFSISLLHEEGSNPDCSSPVAFLSILEVPSKNKMCLGTQLNCQKCTDFQAESKEAYSPCIIDISAENESLNSPESIEEAVECLKNEGILTGALWKQMGQNVGGRLMQFLMNFRIPRGKPITERLHDVPSNKWRRYKRSASFDSRKIALLFSILSSLGTLVLIYLTLRVRQRAEGFISI